MTEEKKDKPQKVEELVPSRPDSPLEIAAKKLAGIIEIVQGSDHPDRVRIAGWLQQAYALLK